jgi:hypothetical protein
LTGHAVNEDAMSGTEEVELPIPVTLIGFCKLSSANMRRCLLHLRQHYSADLHCLDKGSSGFTPSTMWAQKVDMMHHDSRGDDFDLLHVVLEHSGMLQYEAPIRARCAKQIDGVREMLKRTPLPVAELEELGIAPGHRLRLNKALTVYRSRDGATSIATWNKSKGRVQRVKVGLKSLAAFGTGGGSAKLPALGGVAAVAAAGGGVGGAQPKAPSVPTGASQLDFLLRVFGKRRGSLDAFADASSAGFSDAEQRQAALFCMSYRHLLLLPPSPASRVPLRLTRRLAFEQAALLGPPLQPEQLAPLFDLFDAADEFFNGVLTNEELEQWTRRDCGASNGSDVAADSVFFRLLCRDTGATRRPGHIEAGEFIELVELFAMLTEEELVRFAFDELMAWQPPVDGATDPRKQEQQRAGGGRGGGRGGDGRGMLERRPSVPCIEIEGAGGLAARLSRIGAVEAANVAAERTPGMAEAEALAGMLGPCSFAPKTVNQRLFNWLRHASRHSSLKPPHYKNFVTWAEFRAMHAEQPRALLPLFWLQSAFRVASCGFDGPRVWLERRRGLGAKVDVAAAMRRKRRGTPYWPESMADRATEGEAGEEARGGGAGMREAWLARYDALEPGPKVATWRQRRRAAKQRARLLNRLRPPFIHDGGWRQPLVGVHPYHPVRLQEFSRGLPDGVDPLLWRAVLALARLRKRAQKALGLGARRGRRVAAVTAEQVAEEALAKQEAQRRRRVKSAGLLNCLLTAVGCGGLAKARQARRVAATDDRTGKVGKAKKYPKRR